MTASYGISLAFDIYPGDDPRNGTMLVRLTKDDFLDGTMYRAALTGTGSGTIVLPANHAAVLAGYLVADNYVRVVDLGPDEVIGGFFLEEGSQVVLSADEEGGELLSFSGPGTLAFLSRATFPYTLHSLADPQFEEHQNYIYNTGKLRFTGPETYGGVMGRAITEARLDIPNALYTMPAHDWDDTLDSGGTAWTTFDDYYDLTVGDNLLDICADLMGKGIDLMLDPHTFTPQAYLAGTYGTDRTSATFTSGKVRFEAGVNIAADLDKAIHRIPYISHMDVFGDDGVTHTIVVDPDWSSGDPVYKGVLRLDTSSDLTVMEEAGAESIRRRKLLGDQATFPHVPGADANAGLYYPGRPGVSGHYWLGDLVTLHTGSGANDYNEQAIQVAAITWKIRNTGTFDPIVDLGAQYATPRSMAEQNRLTTLLRQQPCNCHVHLCLATIPGTETVGAWEFWTWDSGNPTVAHPGSASVGPVGGEVWGTGATNTAIVNPGTGAEATGYWTNLDHDGGSVSVDVTAGVTYRFSGYFNATQYNFNLRIEAKWLNAADAVIQTDLIRYSAAWPRAWTEWSKDLVAPTGATQVYLISKTSSAGGVGTTGSIDQVRIQTISDAVDTVGTDEYTGSSTDVARCDHNHDHNDLLHRDAADTHAASTISYDPALTSSSATNVQDRLDELLTSLDVSVVTDHGSMGTTETFDMGDGHDHEGTLDNDLTVTLTGAVNDEAAFLTLVLTQDGTGGHDITWPGSVVWPGGVTPTFDTTAGTVSIVNLFSYDGGATVYGFLAGDGGGGAVEAAFRWVPVSIDPLGDEAWELLFDDDGSVVMMEVYD